MFMMLIRSIGAAALAAVIAGPALAQEAARKTAGTSETLMHHEQTMLEALAKKDFPTFQKMIVPAAWNIDETGYMTIEDFIKAVNDPKSNLQFEFKTSKMKVVDINPSTKIVTYQLDQKGSFMGQPFPPTVYASTVWVNKGGTWRAVFHQESTAKPAAK
jgi:hypothetical protein